jgi:Tol biopolymer transport system component
VARRFRLVVSLIGLVVLASGCGSSSGSGLFIVDPKGGDPRKVFSGCIELFAWSPDGNSIALTRTSGALEILNLRDDRSHVVAKVADEFTWSPDSSEIAWGYVPFVGFGKGLWLARSTGSPKPRMIWNGQLRSLAWAPNGKQIAFSPVRSSSSDRARIALVRPDGNGLTYLTGPIAEGFGETVLRWFPDGKWLLFVGPAEVSSSTALWVLRGDGRGLHRLVTEPTGSWPLGDAFAAISPDGARVAYWVRLNRSGPYGIDPNIGEIFIVNVGGSGKRYLGHGALGGWSPDGKQLAFAYHGLYVMNANGTGKRKMTENATDAQWSPRGELAYTDTPSC